MPPFSFFLSPPPVVSPSKKPRPPFPNRQDQTASYQQQPPRQQPQTSIGLVSASAAAATPNSITLLGKLNAPFELRAVPGRASSFGGGAPSPATSVATSQLAFSVGRDKTEWVAVEAWGPLAEAAAASGLGRGDRVAARGRLRCNEYQDRASGQRRRAIKVTLESLARVHDGPGGGEFASQGGGEWADQSQLPPQSGGGAGEWAAPPAFGGGGAAAAASLPSWPAPDAGVDWNASAVVPETPEEWSAAAPAAAAAAEQPAWGGAQQGSDALAWGAAAAAGGSAAAPERAPWDSESPESWGGPSAVPAAAPQQQQQFQQPYQQQQQAGAGGGPQLSGEQKWALFFGDPSAYWDNRLSKRAPRAPDFKHKTSGEGLWVASRDTPAWVEGRLGELPPPRPGKF